MSSAVEIRRLRRERERSRFARGLGLAVLATVALAWLGGAIGFDELFHTRRVDNLVEFVTHDIVPPSVRAGDESWVEWAAPRVRGRYMDALLSTVALAILAAALSAAVGLVLASWTSRTALAAERPFDRRTPPRGARAAIGVAARFLCVVMRALPEYLLAFLFGAVFPDPAWACALALVVHNGGILGRLYGELLENLDQENAATWHGAGSTRGAAVLGAQVPEAMPRGLTYLFLRFETCVRESTILGAIGFVSLGHWIVQERAAGRYDEVVLIVAMGTVVVLVSDFVGRRVRA